MEEESKATMWCATCDKKFPVLEGEVTCPDCGALLEAPEDLEDIAPEEDDSLLGIHVEEKNDDLADQGDIE